MSRTSRLRHIKGLARARVIVGREARLRSRAAWALELGLIQLAENEILEARAFGSSRCLASPAGNSPRSRSPV